VPFLPYFRAGTSEERGRSQITTCHFLWAIKTLLTRLSNNFIIKVGVREDRRIELMKPFLESQKRGLGAHSYCNDGIDQIWALGLGRQLLALRRAEVA
jgi:hypothetical protein